MEPHLGAKSAARGPTQKQFNRAINAWRKDPNRTIVRCYERAVRRSPCGQWEPNHVWVEEQAEFIYVQSGLNEQWLRAQASKLVTAEIESWLKRSRSVLDISIRLAPDPVLITRPVADDEYWQTAQSVATEALHAELDGYTLPSIFPPHPPTWRNRQCPDFFEKFFHKEAFEIGLHLHPTHTPHPPETTWIRGLDDNWAMTMVALEGAISAYLEETGFGLEYWQDVLGWKSQSSLRSLDAIPAWKWHLVREAYVVAWLWGLAFIVYSLWSPLDADCQADLRQAIKSLAAMMGWHWGLRPLRWEGTEIKIHSDPHFMVSRFPNGTVELEECTPFPQKAKSLISHLFGEETAFQGLPDPTSRSFQYLGREVTIDGQDSGLICGTARASNLVRRPGVFRRGERGQWVGDNTLEAPLFAKFVGEHQCLLGLNTEDRARAFQLLGNIFLAPQSRLATLRLGVKLSQRGRYENLPEVLVKMCGQFCRLSTPDWIEGARLTALFAGCHLDQAGEALLKPTAIRVDDFDAWNKIGFFRKV